VEYGAIDLHKNESQIRIVTEDGELVDRRIATTRDHLTAVFAKRPLMRILVESSTESEWVAQHLETFGHEVIVADPNYAPMYGHRTRRVKTDLRDVAALADACMHGIYRAVHRRSERQRTVQQQLNVRDALVQTRTRAISLARATTRANGFRLRSGTSETFVRRVEELGLPPAVATALAPLCHVIDVVSEELDAADARLAAATKTDPAVRRLMTLPGIGPITATAFIAALDDAGRFRRPGQVASYLGLVPCEYSSGEKRRRGRVMRSAHPRVQALLVQAGWRVWRSRRPETEPLRRWTRSIADRRGKKVAVVALARRLARILFGMWRDETDFAAERVGAGRVRQRAATPGPNAKVA